MTVVHSAICDVCFLHIISKLELYLTFPVKNFLLLAYFSFQVKEAELAVEEQELQKHAVVKRKFEEMSKLEERIQELEEQLVEKETVSQDLEKSRQELIGESQV
jgi:hypothetical protein